MVDIDYIFFVWVFISSKTSFEVFFVFTMKMKHITKHFTPFYVIGMKYKMDRNRHSDIFYRQQFIDTYKKNCGAISGD